jgi:S1/P1 Nuclease
MKKILFILFTIACSPAFTWWYSSHMVVAQIAENHLTPRAKFHSEELISLLADHYPASADFITASCWADDVKGSLLDFSPWHKQLLPYDPDEILLPSQKEQLVVKAKDKGLEYGIKKCVDILKDSTANFYDKGIALRLLMHLVADAHMPLHCATLYNQRFPTGDQGGILFALKNILEEESNLHGLWDSCFLLDYYEFKRPLTIHAKKHIEQFAQQLMLRFPVESLLESRDLDVSHWIQDSYELAGSVVYQGIEPHLDPSLEYRNKGKSVACRQLTLAGYRLSSLLNEIFEDYK